MQETQALYPELAGCSFDKGFHSPGNRAELDKVLALNALPQKGKLSRRGEREAEAAFEARRMHPAVNLHSQPGVPGIGPGAVAGAGGLCASGRAVGAGVEPAPHRTDPAAAGAGTAEAGEAAAAATGGVSAAKRPEWNRQAAQRQEAREVRKVSESGFETGLGPAMRGQTGTAPDNRTVTRFTYAPAESEGFVTDTR